MRSTSIIRIQAENRAGKKIKQLVLNKWEKGHLLRCVLQNDGLFPLCVKLVGPTVAEISNSFSEMIDWIKQLEQHDKSAIGYGYTLVEKEFHLRLCGKNSIPTHVEISTLNDAVKLIGKQADLQLFKQSSNALLQEWECLRGWILKNPFQVISIGENCEKVLSVLSWFSQHRDRNLYLRQLDIEGVDTKFIELHKGLFMQLLDIILPEEQMNPTSVNFEKRYGLKSKPNLLRFRILDRMVSKNGCTDISVPLEEFQQLCLPLRRCFITENEINFLSFPYVPDSCAIFGKGYGVELFCDIRWMREMEIYYWGDIDTHGFNILGMARGFLPQTQSFLMTQEVLLSHRALWSKEEKPFLAPIAHLTPEESLLACNLQKNHWGEGVRLEQERIRFSEVEHFLTALPKINP